MRRALVVGRGAAEAAAGVEGLEIKVLDDVVDLDAHRDDVDVVVIDERAGDLTAVIERFKEELGTRPVIAAIRDGDPNRMLKALQSGAVGVVRYPVDPSELADAIDVVLAGGSYLGREATKGMVTALRVDTPPLPAIELTEREKEVLRELAQGLSARQVATRLKLSERTINTHVANVYRKLGVSNRVEAVRVGIKLGIVPSP